MGKVKISQLPVKGDNLENTDLLPIAEDAGGGAYVTKRIDGSQINVIGSQDLQSVTDIGNSTTNDIQVISATTTSAIGSSQIITGDDITGASVSLNYYGTVELANGVDNGIGVLAVTNVDTASVTLEFPNKATGSYTIATTSDLTSGTVTSVSALTLGTTGTDLSSSVATGTTTPVITLNVPTASATNRGVLSSSDWSTFNNKVSTGAITGSGLTMATSRLLGRTTASTGSVEEITVGTGLTLSGGTLSAAPNVQSVLSAATVTPTASNDLVKITAQAVALTLAAPTGSPVDGQALMIRIKDNGTARAITWTSGTGGYRAIGVTLPTTTVAGKTTYVGLIYNSDDSRWDAIGVTTEA